MRKFYSTPLQVLSPVVLGVLLGLISGIVINLLTDTEQLSLNRKSIKLFFFSIFPLLAMMHIRDEYQFSYLHKIAAGGTHEKAWDSTVGTEFKKKDGIFIVSFFILAALITFAILCMKKPEPSITASNPVSYTIIKN